jgi:hypothetical protein
MQAKCPKCKKIIDWVPVYGKPQLAELEKIVVITARGREVIGVKPHVCEGGEQIGTSSIEGITLVP